MKDLEKLNFLFAKQNGIVKTAQVLEKNIPKYTLYEYAKQNEIEPVAHGIYLSPDA